MKNYQPQTLQNLALTNILQNFRKQAHPTEASNVIDKSSEKNICR